MGLPRRGWKAVAYARERIADYWILDLGAARLELYREPDEAGPARRHWGYAGWNSWAPTRPLRRSPRPGGHPRRRICCLGAETAGHALAR